MDNDYLLIRQTNGGQDVLFLMDNGEYIRAREVVNESPSFVQIVRSDAPEGQTNLIGKAHIVEVTA